MEKVEIYKEDILKLAAKNPDFKPLLIGLCPSVFDEEEEFCNIKDVFIRKGTKGLYRIYYSSNNNIGIRNLVSGGIWEPALRVDFTWRATGIVTKGMFRRLIEGRSKSITDFKVISVPELHKLLGL